MAGKERARKLSGGEPGISIMLAQPGVLSVLVSTPKNSVGAPPHYALGPLGSGREVSSRGTLRRVGPRLSLFSYWALVGQDPGSRCPEVPSPLPSLSSSSSLLSSSSCLCPSSFSPPRLLLWSFS